jgi:hypothetical protein
MSAAEIARPLVAVAKGTDGAVGARYAVAAI